jgi:hypothetical protein
MYSGQSAGISPYDCRTVIINIFTIDNKLSMCDYKRLNVLLILKIQDQKNMNSGQPEQEFQCAGTGVPARSPE